MTEHQTHRFSAEGDSTTRWVLESEVELKHHRVRLMRRLSFLGEDAQRALESFKAFAESADGRKRLAASNAAAAEYAPAEN